jgi:hypothetical protein
MNAELIAHALGGRKSGNGRTAQCPTQFRIARHASDADARLPKSLTGQPWD